MTEIEASSNLIVKNVIANINYMQFFKAFALYFLKMCTARNEEIFFLFCSNCRAIKKSSFSVRKNSQSNFKIFAFEEVHYSREEIAS